MSFRKPSNRGGGKKFIGKFPSFRMDAIVWFESLLERDYLYLLEFDLAVLAFYAQACRFYYRLGGKKRIYTADFYVIRQDSKQVVEVKPEAKAREPEKREIFCIAAEACERQGMEFRVVTDAEIRSEPRLDNVKLLIKYQRTPIDPQHRILCHEFFARRPEASLAQVAEFFASKGVGRQTVYSLMRWGAIGFDLKTPIDDDCALFYPGRDAAEREVRRAAV